MPIDLIQFCKTTIFHQWAKEPISFQPLDSDSVCIFLSILLNVYHVVIGTENERCSFCVSWYDRFSSQPFCLNQAREGEVLR